MDQPSLPSQADFSAARENMVNGQVRPNKVTDPRIIRAMRSLPREQFVPPALVSLAYTDTDVPLARGRAVMEPMVIARLVQLARVRAGERVLVIGAGTGYGAALMAACGGEVTALEEDAALLDLARRALRDTAPGVKVVEGRLTDGQPGVPWDVIMIEGAVQSIPQTIALQLNPAGGRLVTVLSPGEGAGGYGVLAEPGRPDAPNSVLRAQPVFDCATRLLPPLVPAPAFQF
jgi:protein-L-isoaspartate(D-aspartate) O-methyltransferase